MYEIRIPKPRINVKVSDFTRIYPLVSLHNIKFSDILLHSNIAWTSVDLTEADRSRAPAAIDRYNPKASLRASAWYAEKHDSFFIS